MSRAARVAKRIPRKPGRPVSGGASQRERRLDAAVRSFAARGIAATSLRSLAHQTGVMPAVGMLQRKIEASSEAEPLALMRTLVAGIHEMVAEHPWLPGL